eukprot:TRINITY_DN3347_c0_g2_i1.p1 TRINITY_DN3347_c0_g2~~TRINITY_DN3347_c0_g2_i1.p1  ORF type:complete len:308 (+),score=58.08 TRINITY_DN3347_c0_g2_i1:50-973(+)
MALSGRDCLSLQAFAEHSEICDDLISLVARARFQFAGKARSSTMTLDADSCIEEMSALPTSCNASEVMTLCSDQTMRLCCLDRQQVIQETKDAFVLEPNAAVTLNVLPMRMISTSGGDIGLWSLSNGWNCRNIGKHKTSIRAASPVFNGSQLAVGSGAGLHLWDIETGSSTEVLDDCSISHITKLDQHTLALCVSKSTPLIYDLREKRVVCSIENGGARVCNIQAITPTRIAVTGQHNKCVVYELKSNGAYSKTQILIHNQDGFPQHIKAVDHQSKLLASTTSRPSSLHIWSLSKDWMGWMDPHKGC